jgi:hypothetical protein
MTNEMIFVMDMLDIENLNDEKYKWPFYLMLRDLEHEGLGNRVENAKHQ